MNKIKSMRIDDVSYDIGADYSNIDNTPTFKTINNQSILGTGNIVIEGGSGEGAGMIIPPSPDRHLSFLLRATTRPHPRTGR